MEYAEENLRSAKVLCESHLYNPALNNAQQAVEKALKALLIERSVRFRKTHSINELRRLVFDAGIRIELNEDECDLLDSIYLPSKYPLGSALPDYSPDLSICSQCISVAERVLKEIQTLLAQGQT